MGFSLSQKSDNSFFKSLLIVYYSSAVYWIISTKVFAFGNASIEVLKDIAPVVDNARLLFFLGSALSVLIYGLNKAVKEPRPVFLQIPMQYYYEPERSIVFIDGMIKGLSKFVIRVWNIMAIILNKLVFIVGCAFFYISMAIRKIFNEIIYIFSESKDLITAGVIIFFSFLIAETSINLGANQYHYLMPDCMECGYVLKSLFFDLIKLSFYISLISLFPFFYDNVVQVFFNNANKNQRIANNNSAINVFFAEIVESVLMVGLFFTLSGWLLFISAKVFDFFNVNFLSSFKDFGKYTFASTVLIIVLVFLYIAYVRIQKMRKN